MQKKKNGERKKNCARLYKGPAPPLPECSACPCPRTGPRRIRDPFLPRLVKAGRVDSPSGKAEGEACISAESPKALAKAVRTDAEAPRGRAAGRAVYRVARIWPPPAGQWAAGAAGVAGAAEGSLRGSWICLCPVVTRAAAGPYARARSVAASIHQQGPKRQFSPRNAPQSPAQGSLAP